MIFSSGNLNKLEEIREFFSDMEIEILSLKDLELEGFEVEEDKDSLEGNAEKKARSLFELVKKPVFADDTGLFVEALNGAPGVYSARFASEHATYKDNRIKMLKELYGIEDRRAHFKTVICYVDADAKSHFFEGRVDGTIATEEHGEQGFGYDSLFFPDGEGRSFGEMSIEEKAKFSHRVKALSAFKNYLLSLQN